ncbi:serine/arginine repetitive matrix protein 2-like, partial [Physella acuta]|uniref:serine/arginine repetitive matrix protein 2-like n=1 Tax=Physella acuta TaxID=109671 RepID=UPI0027DB3884
MDDVNSHKSSSLEENASLLIGGDSAKAADAEKIIPSVEESDKNNHDDIDLDRSIKQNDDYYEVISADGSIGGEDIDGNDIENDNVCSNSTFQNEQCSFLDLPFVPKIDFPNEASKSASTDSNSFHFEPIFGSHNVVNHCNTTPNVLPQFDFSKPPPNLNFTANPHTSCFVDSEINPNLTPQGHIGFGNASSKHFSAISNNSNSASSVILSKDHKSSPSSTLTQVAKAPIVDWLDENGDPIKGAFDNIPIHVSEEAEDAAKSSKVEYVFSVKEKKKVSVSSDFSDVVSTSSLINTNVLLKNVAGKVSIDSSTASDPKIYEEEKKLYLASKSGEEYKAAILSNTPSTSAEATAVPSGKTLSENENAKKERYNRFRRNRFTDKKDDPVPEAVPKEEPKKTQEEVALESQAVVEILKEVQRGAERAKEHGALGWQKCPVPVTNKTFLRNTLVSTLREPYRPPSKRGRFHVGLDGDKKGRDEKDGEASSRSSRSSRSSSRSSRSYSSRSSDRELPSAQGKHFQNNRGRGSWARGQNQYFDAWAAYYGGYQWYGPEAYGMYYGPEGWPMDAYTAMYYGDPQAWAEYEAYYGPQNFRGRGMRGRGRGRGRGRFPEDFRNMEHYSRSRSRSPGYSRSPSSSFLSYSRSRSRSLSRSRSRSVGGSRTYRAKSSRERSRSMSAGGSRTHRIKSSRGRSRSISAGGSRTQRAKSSRERSRVSTHSKHSDSVSKERKKKKKKKKKHKKKSKKSKEGKEEKDGEKARDKEFEKARGDKEDSEEIHKNDLSGSRKEGKQKSNEKTAAEDSRKKPKEMSSKKGKGKNRVKNLKDDEDGPRDTHSTHDGCGTGPDESVGQGKPGRASDSKTCEKVLKQDAPNRKQTQNDIEEESGSHSNDRRVIRLGKFSGKEGTQSEKSREKVKSRLGKSSSEEVTQADKSRDSVKSRLKSSSEEVTQVEKSRDSVKSRLGKPSSEEVTQVEKSRDSVKSRLGKSSSEEVTQVEKSRDSVKSRLGKSSSEEVTQVEKSRDSVKSRLKSSSEEVTQVEKSRDSVKSRLGKSSSEEVTQVEKSNYSIISKQSKKPAVSDRKENDSKRKSVDAVQKKVKDKLLSRPNGSETSPKSSKSCVEKSSSHERKRRRESEDNKIDLRDSSCDREVGAKRIREDKDIKETLDNKSKLKETREDRQHSEKNSKETAEETSEKNKSREAREETSEKNKSKKLYEDKQTKDGKNNLKKMKRYETSPGESDKQNKR